MTNPDSDSNAIIDGTVVEENGIYFTYIKGKKKRVPTPIPPVSVRREESTVTSAEGSQESTVARFHGLQSPDARRKP